MAYNLQGIVQNVQNWEMLGKILNFFRNFPRNVQKWVGNGPGWITVPVKGLMGPLFARGIYV